MSERSARRHPQFFQFGFLETFGFGPSILEPNFHLRFGQGQGSGKFSPFGNGQVLFLSEFLLQGHQLLCGERRSRFAIGFVLAQLATELTARRQFGQTVQVMVMMMRI
jgi:hypothetical protein